MTKVNFYECEIKYTGKLSSYSLVELLAKALDRMYHGVDAYDHSEIMSEEQAKKIDGNIEIIRDYPDNKLAVIGWSYIEELGDLDDEDDEADVADDCGTFDYNQADYLDDTIATPL